MSEQPGPFGVRRAGVLLHVTSLPSGDLGDDAFGFVDFLADAGCSVWQVLPLVPTHEEDRSPYNSLSSMAGNPELISDARREQPDNATLADWCAQHRDWLEPYVEFVALRELQGGTKWWTWEPGLRDRDPNAVTRALAPVVDRVVELKREQWQFARQWQRLREHAAEKGVLFFGDLPIFVSLDSADVWAHRELFLLDESGQPITVTGCPPDYFAEDGQRWNNPHYDWDAMAADGYDWWRRRIARQRELFDLVRIDHFRGFEAAWHIPADAPTARDGKWVEAPGAEVLAALIDEAGTGTLVAEDLGVITPEVDALRTSFRLPGMKVLQFAFDGALDNPYLPVNHDELSVVYTGTHDNDTTVGWWASIDDRTRTQAASHLIDPSEEMPGALVRLAMASTARLAVVPAQDLLALGSESRMNTPGTETGNWSWQAPPGVFDEELAARFRAVVRESGRQ